jgi:predicted transcriptional regulator
MEKQTMTVKKDKSIQRPMYLRPDQLKALDALAQHTRIQRSILVREAVDDLLKKHAKTLKGGAK